MTLQEDLTKFQKQQQRCQSTLSRYSARQAPIEASHPPKSPSTMRRETPPVTPSSATTGISMPTGKFSENTKRLQLIYNTSKAPVGAQMKKVIELLEQTRKAFTVEDIFESCYVDMNKNKEVFDSLTQNVKVKYDGLRFSYKPKYEIKDKDSLLQMILSKEDGIAIFDLKDSYLDAMKDLMALKAEGKIWLLLSSDSKDDIAYPNDPKLSTFKVDDDLKQLFRNIELPEDFLDIEKDLRKQKLIPATNTAKRRAAAQSQGKSSSKSNTKKKEKDFPKRIKLTNSHLPELFQHPKTPKP